MAVSVQTIFCDDIRKELSGKDILIGVYAMDLVPALPLTRNGCRVAASRSARLFLSQMTRNWCVVRSPGENAVITQVEIINLRLAEVENDSDSELVRRSLPRSKDCHRPSRDN